MLSQKSYSSTIWLLYVIDFSVTSGTIYLPTAKECNNDVMLPGTMSWVIQLNMKQVAYLQFDEILFK